MILHEELTEEIIGCAIEVHRNLGPGLLESIYESALCIEFGNRNIHYDRQHPLTVNYKGQHIGDYKIDLLVEDTVVVELKSTERHDPVFEAQLLSYMRAGKFRVGLLINFNSILLTKGIKRFIV